MYFELTPRFGNQILPEVPLLYYEIAKQQNDFVVLEVPITGDTASSGLSMWFYYFQTIHEKPLIYSTDLGPRDSTGIRQIRQYFLNYFTNSNFESDIIQQDLSDVGINLFNYFDVGYVIVHKTSESVIGRSTLLEERANYVNEMKLTLHNIFDKEPDFEDEQIVAYKVPLSQSDIPFLTLNRDWDRLSGTNTNFYRTLYNDKGTIAIVNPSDTDTNVAIDIYVASWSDDAVIGFEFEEKKLFETKVSPTDPIKISSNLLNLKPGTNYLSVYTMFPDNSKLNCDRYQINPEIGFFKIDLILDTNEYKEWKTSPSVYHLNNIKEMNCQIDELYWRILERPPDSIGRNSYIHHLIDNGESYEWLELSLKTSPESRNLMSSKINDIFFTTLNREPSDYEIEILSNKLIEGETIEWVESVLRSSQEALKKNIEK